MVLILLANCSFDTKTGIWTGVEDEVKRIIELEKEQLKRKNIKKIYSSKNIEVISVSASKPSLDDVFLQVTGYRLEGASDQEVDSEEELSEYE